MTRRRRTARSPHARLGWASLAAALLLGAALHPASGQAAQRSLDVAPSGHHLVRPDGTPFLYLGDTAWELFHRLDLAEAEFYLRDRANKGFTVVQAALLAELDGLRTPNALGDTPLEGDNPARPRESYFRHVDAVVGKAAELGLFMGLLPTWGDKWHDAGKTIFDPANARAYGEFLGRRYRERPVIWILGGDRMPETDLHRQVLRAMAEGLRAGDGGAHLITFHPRGPGNSATLFHQEPWLDFNMTQSGHLARHWTNFVATLENRSRTPPKPTLDGEPRYEDHPINWQPSNGWFDDADVRQAAYWSVLAGACGHTYGNHNVWQFWQPGRQPVSSARTPWREALAHPGATHMGHLRRLLESRPWQTLVPDPAALHGELDGGGDLPMAARAADESFLFVYVPTGRPIVVRLNRISGSRVNAWWFDPRHGIAADVGLFASLGVQRFEPFSHGPGQDWVLVLDDAAKKYPKPGAGRDR